MSKLALLGGTPVLSMTHKPYRSMGEREEQAALEVVRSGCLSGFYGSPGDEFLGGPKIREFESAWEKRYGVKRAISVNSATSGLVAALGAVGIGPGDEVIVPPWTMSATVVAPLVYGGIPVFADVEDETFGLDPAAVSAKISPRTRAIVAVNLFGHAARLTELRALADKHGLALIEDNAQAPIGEDAGRLCGTIGDIGVYSLNFHKHIHTGEGGICVTNDEDLAKRLELIRNHGENAVESYGLSDISNTWGLNLRMTEFSAAIGLVQLDDVDQHVERREKIARTLSEGTAHLEGWTVPHVREGCRHNYYVWLVRFDERIIGVSRELFSKAMNAEGFENFTGYLAPLYRLPIFQQRVASGKEGFPFNLTDQTYQDGDCPTCERLHEKEAILFEPCAYDLDDDTISKMIEAICKVHKHRHELAALEKE